MLQNKYLAAVRDVLKHIKKCITPFAINCVKWVADLACLPVEIFFCFFPILGLGLEPPFAIANATHKSAQNLELC